MTRSERQIAALQEECANLRVMAAEFDLFMKAVILKHATDEVYVLEDHTARLAATHDGIVRIEKVEDSIHYRICETPNPASSFPISLAQ